MGVPGFSPKGQLSNFILGTIMPTYDDPRSYTHNSQYILLQTFKDEHRRLNILDKNYQQNYNNIRERLRTFMKNELGLDYDKIQEYDNSSLFDTIYKLQELIKAQHNYETRGKVFQRDFPPVAQDLYAKQIGPINPAGIPFVSSRDTNSAVQGFKKRIIPYVPKPKGEAIKLVRNTMDYIISITDPLPYMAWNDEYINAFLEHYDKPMKIKEELKEQYYIGINEGLTKEDYKLKSFIKQEFYEDAKYARMIMSRSLRLKALMSEGIHQFDEYLFHKSPLSKFFIKGMTPQEQVEAMSKKFEGHKLFLETDYSSFESCFSPKFQKEVEIRMFKHMFSNNPHILKLILSCYKTHKIKGKGFHGELVGGRMSGDLWTSSMNGFSNLVIIMTLAAKHHLHFDGFCEGDDGLFWLDGKDITQQDYEDLGFLIKMDYKGSIQECSFCGKIFDETSKHVLGTPEQLNRIGWALDKSYWNASDKVKQQLVLSRALSLAVLYPGCPCIQARAKALLQSARGKIMFTRRILQEKYQLREMLKYHKELDLQKLYNKLEFPEPTLEDRLLYESRFGISIDAQYRYEEYVTNNPWADCELVNTDSHTGGVSNAFSVISLYSARMHV
jgi:hypothetical protein